MKMPLKVLISVTLTLVLIQGTAQSIDSLLSVYKNTTDTVSKKNLSVTIGRYYQTTNAYAKAIEYLKNGLSSSDNLQNIPILKNLAYCYHELGNQDEEIQSYQQILTLTEHQRDTTQIVETMQTLSGLMEETGQYDVAISINKRILNLAEIKKNYLWASISLNNLGYLFSVKKMQLESEAYFKKSYSLAKQPDTNIPNDLRASVLINLGVANARLQKYREAEQYLTEAYELRLLLHDKIKTAEALNYLASFDFIQGNLEKARLKVQQAIDIINPVAETSEKFNTQLACYKLMSQIMLKANNLKEYRKYTEYANTLQQKIIEHDRRSIKILLQQQLEVERKESEYRLLLSENEVKNSKLRQSELEREKKERELELHLKQLAILKKENELQASRYSNQRLENEKINQQLELIQQQSKVADQEQSIKLLQKESELQNLTLAQRKNEIERLELEKKQSAKLKIYGLTIIALLVLLLIIGVFGYIIRVKRSRLLALQFETINQLNEDLHQRNEELTTINDQLADKTEELHVMNTQLDNARQIVEHQNKQLQTYTLYLKGEVEIRTKEIIEKNLELVQYTNQLEQFTYAVSHNIRAPIARLQGLLSLLDITKPEERDAVLGMLRASATELDYVVNDLHEILTIRSSKVVYEEVNIKELIENIVHEITTKTSPDVEIKTHISTIYLQGVKAYIDSILRDLLDNAIKFRTPTNPCVVSITAERNDHHTVLTITDNGIGFDLEHYRHKLFKFYTRMNTNFSGKGLGLYRVKTHTDAMNGEITVTSAPNKGTSFRISFPDQ